MDKIHRLFPFGARAGCSAQPLRVMDRNGTFPARRTAKGRRDHTPADALRFPGEGDKAPNNLTVVHGQTSRRGQQDDPQRQVSALEAHCRGAVAATA